MDARNSSIGKMPSATATAVPIMCRMWCSMNDCRQRRQEGEMLEGRCKQEQEVGGQSHTSKMGDFCVSF